jgi:hypothetical protein
MHRQTQVVELQRNRRAQQYGDGRQRMPFIGNQAQRFVQQCCVNQRATNSLRKPARPLSFAHAPLGKRVITRRFAVVRDAA